MPSVFLLRTSLSPLNVMQGVRRGLSKYSFLACQSIKERCANIFRWRSDYCISYNGNAAEPFLTDASRKRLRCLQIQVLTKKTFIQYADSSLPLFTADRTIGVAYLRGRTTLSPIFCCFLSRKIHEHFGESDISN